MWAWEPDCMASYALALLLMYWEAVTSLCLSFHICNNKPSVRFRVRVRVRARVRVRFRAGAKARASVSVRLGFGLGLGLRSG